MSKSEHHIDKLTPELIEKYHQGILSESEAYQVERLMLNSDFDAEAMEGFEDYSGDIQSDLNQLNSRLEKRIAEEKNDNSFFWIKIAASVLILALSSYLVWDIMRSDSIAPLQTNEIAQTKDIDNNETIDSNKVEESIEEKSSIVDNTIEEPDEEIQVQGDAEMESESKLEEEKVLAYQEQKSKPPSLSRANPMIMEEVVVEESAGRELDEVEPQLKTDNYSLEEVIQEENESNENLSKVEIKGTTASNLDALEGKIAGVNISKKRNRKTEATPASFDELEDYSSTLTGMVTSAEDGSALPGVNVILKGTTIGTVTDIDGKYKLDVAETSESKTLVFSSIGLATEEIKVGEKYEIDIQLQADVQQLSEVVVTRSNTNNLGGIYKFAQPSIGMVEYKKYLADNIQYPTDTIVESGRVIVTFDVNVDGTLDNYSIKRGIGEWHNNEAIRLIKEGPDWVPSTNDGVPEKGNVKVVVKFRQK